MEKIAQNKIEDEALIFETSEDVEVVQSFDDLNLKDELLRGNPGIK
jgi:hypothetical protein